VRQILKTPLLISVLAGVLLGVVGILVRATGILQPLDLALYDWHLRHQDAPKDAWTSPIVLVTITEQYIKQSQWPVSDVVLARVLERLLQGAPRAIGIDLYRDKPEPPGYQEFREILRRDPQRLNDQASPGYEELSGILRSHPNIIAITKLGDGDTEGVPPPAALAGTGQVGFNDYVFDPGGVIRRGLLFLHDALERPIPSFALALALVYLQGEGQSAQPDPDRPEYLRLGKTTLRPLRPDDGGYVGLDAGGYQFLLDYKRAHESYPSVPIERILDRQFEPARVRDKIVLIGTVSAASAQDVFHTPLHTGFVAAPLMPGVVLHGQVVDQLLSIALLGQAPVVGIEQWQENLWILIWGVQGGLMGLLIRRPWRYATALGVGGLVLVLGAHGAFNAGWWVPLAPIGLSWLSGTGVVTAYLSYQERKQRAVLMQLFSRHVSKEVAENIWQQREQFLENGRPRSQTLTATVLFTDFKGFTAVSEKMTPQALLDWVNIYLDAMAGIVMRYGGVVDDYAGDAIKANFGVPFARSSEAEIQQDAVNAVSCAAEMEREMHRLNATHEAQGLPTVGMRIGIYTGPVVAGSVGSTERLKYTTVGDTVNTAARLESLDRELVAETPGKRPCRILVGERTLQYLGGRFHAEPFGELSLKGKSEKILAYRILHDQSDETAQLGQRA
jgi:adenylate cyclase